MADRAFVAFATRTGTTRIHAPPRELPIVVVPDFMGTRLTDPVSGSLVWNPLGKPFGAGPRTFEIDYGRIGQTAQELVPDETHGFEDKADVETHAAITNAPHLVAAFYGPLVRGLAALDTPQMQKLGVRPRVYCSGYDWRQDHTRGALRLAAVVERALRETGARQVVIVAHGAGGLVARLYCRILGGEQRVHQLFLLASPTLGAPSAYLQLRRGLEGIYAKDILRGAQGSEPVDWISEGADLAQTLVGGVSGLFTGSAVDKLTGFFGGVYPILCVATGRWLRRREVIYLLRQWPGLYQMLPNALYCDARPNWLLFDPTCTGHKPTGFMVVIPSMLDAMLAANKGIMKAAKADFADSVAKDIEGFLRPENAERTSGLATRNMTTIQDIAAEIGAKLEDVADSEETLKARGKGADFGDRVAPVGDIVELVMKIKDRIDAVFLDARHPASTYYDIYTGLLDGVPLRAISTAGLALSLRLDAMLTENHRPAAPLRFTELLGRVVRVLMVGLKAIGLNVDLAFLADALDQDKPDPNAPKPVAYMPPNAYCVSCEDEPTETSCLLLPTNQLSNDDSNVVKTAIVPNLLASVALLVPAWRNDANPLGAASLGDGTVPALSQRPRPEMLSRPFRATRQVPRTKHARIPASEVTLAFLTEEIDKALVEWLQGRAPVGGEAL